MNKKILKWFPIIALGISFNCSPKIAPDVSADISSKEALEIVWPHRFRNTTDTTEILEFRGVNLFYYSRGDRMFGWNQTIGFYKFKGDTIIFTRMSDKQLNQYAKYDSSWVVQELIRNRTEIAEQNRTMEEKEEERLEKVFLEEFSWIEGKDTPSSKNNYWHGDHRYFYEAAVEKASWLLKDKKTILKISRTKNSPEIFRKEEKETKKWWRFW